MNQQQQFNLVCELSTICIFRNILNHKVMVSFINFLKTKDCIQKKLELFGEFVYSLAEFNYSFSDFLCQAIYTDENQYIISVAHKSEISKFIEENTKKELQLFSTLTKLNSQELCSSLNFDGYIPNFQNTEIDFIQTYTERIQNIDKYGYGIFATEKMFQVLNNEIIPIKSADQIDMDSFIGYREERKQVFDNTKALCNGRVASNILLYGDAGTGKSSTVKACANYFFDQGVRLIEIRKDQLISLSNIMGKIIGNPLKFIIFIDDLSFNKNDDCFSMLKAALEGSASAKAKNAVIYATSNRRHIVKETFSDREEYNDDIHKNDTIQELTSLSDRFGLTVYFEKPNKTLYLDIVHNLAKKHSIDMPLKELDIRAEAFALNKGNRSPRIAEQFINNLLLEIR